MTNEEAALGLVDREMRAFVRSIREEHRGWFFDPRNRDEWMDGFIDHLREKYQQPDRIASND